MFIISTTFARGRYSLIVSDLVRHPQVGVRNEVVVGVGWRCNRKGKEDLAGCAHMCSALALLVQLISCICDLL